MFRGLDLFGNLCLINLILALSNFLLRALLVTPLIKLFTHFTIAQLSTKLSLIVKLFF